MLMSWNYQIGIASVEPLQNKDTRIRIWAITPDVLCTNVIVYRIYNVHWCTNWQIVEIRPSSFVTLSGQDNGCFTCVFY